MAVAADSEDWKRIAEEITKEPDGSKLAELVRKMCDALDRGKDTGLANTSPGET